jgi:hypothetical protein
MCRLYPAEWWLKGAVMTTGTFTNVTIRSDTAGAIEDLLTLDSVAGSAGNGAALRFIDNSATAGLHLTLGRITTSRVSSTTARLDLAIVADPTVSSGDDTPALLSLISGPSGLSVATATGSAFVVGDRLNVTNAATLGGSLSVTGAATLNGGASIAGNLSVTGTVNARNIAADGTKLDQHVSNTVNPHSTTAAQVGALSSVAGVRNPGGDIALIADAAITLSADDAANRITIGESHSARSDNPHGTTAAQVGALPSTGGSISGQLGIGQAIPAQALHVGIDQSVRLELGPNAKLSLGGNGPLEIDAPGVVGGRFVVTDAGKVGIGIDDPQVQLDVNGDIRMAATKTLSSPGRMHISGEENLYLLNKGGVFVSEAWGGNGNLSVGGILTVAGDINLGSKLYSSGRMHITGEEILFLLNKGGVNISQAWGGNGNLTVDGDLFVAGRTQLGGNDAEIIIGGNQTGPFLQMHDDLWFSDPQNGTIQIRNHDNSNWGTMVGHFRPPSSIEYKKDTSLVNEPELADLLDDTLHTNIVRFRYKGDNETSRLRLGVIVEDCPAYMVGEDGKSLSSTEYITMLHGAIKVLAGRVAMLEMNPNAPTTTA